MQCYNLWTLHPDLSDQSTFSQLHCYYRWVLDVSTNLTHTLTAWSGDQNHHQDQKSFIWNRQGTKQECDPQRICACRKNSEQWILHTGTGQVIGIDSKWGHNFKRQLVPSVHQCPCSFAMKEKCFTRISWHNWNQPYSPDFVAADTFLFPKVGTTSKGRRVQEVLDMKNDVTAEINAVQQNFLKLSVMSGGC